MPRLRLNSANSRPCEGLSLLQSLLICYGLLEFLRPVTLGCANLSNRTGDIAYLVSGAPRQLGITAYLNTHAPPHEIMGVRKEVSICRYCDLKSHLKFFCCYLVFQPQNLERAMLSDELFLCRLELFYRLVRDCECFLFIVCSAELGFVSLIMYLI